MVHFCLIQPLSQIAQVLIAHITVLSCLLLLPTVAYCPSMSCGNAPGRFVIRGQIPPSDAHLAGQPPLKVRTPNPPFTSHLESRQFAVLDHVVDGRVGDLQGLRNLANS